jgi:hypothetical protein
MMNEEGFESVEKFRNVHKGKTGFVLGAGYSLTECDINSVIKKGISFSCNSSIVSIDECDYFSFTDGVIPYFEFYKKAARVAKNLIFAGKGIDLKFYYEDINAYNQNIEFKAKKHLINRRYGGINFNLNTDINAASFDYVDGLLIDGTDVCHSATHLAHICGCNPIILIGVDLNYKGSERYHKSLSDPEMLQYENSPYKYMDDIKYFGRENNSDSHLMDSYTAWQKIKTSNPNINIKNANPNGLLANIFETINIKEYES